jgi:hypothetical protein
VCALGATQPAVAAPFDVDAFIDEIVISGNSLDIGERTAYTPPGGLAIPPHAAINGPVTSGTVRGQFEFQCTGNTPADCPDSAYAASVLNWKWGVLRVTDPQNFPNFTADFVEVAGENLFPSDLAVDEGWTTIEHQSFDGQNLFTRLAHFEFNLEGAGVTLQPGNSYVIFALLSEFPQPNRVPGEGPGFTGIAEESIFQSAVIDAPPFQFHQAFVVFDPTGQTNQLATSRLIPVVPEPGTAVLLFMIAAFGLARRRVAAR